MRVEDEERKFLFCCILNVRIFPVIKHAKETFDASCSIHCVQGRE